MSSVLNVDTIANKAGSGPVGLTKQSAAKAFVWTASGASNTTNFNISSTTDSGTGNYSAALSSVLDATTYPAVMGTHAVTDNERNVQTGTNNTTNTIAMSAMVGSTLTDFVVNSAVFGDLA